MKGETNTLTGEEHDEKFKEELLGKKWSEFILQTEADASTIKGVNLPHNRTTIEECTVPELRDYIGCRGGKISGNRSELLAIAKSYQYLEKQVKNAYVDRYPDQSTFADVNTSSTVEVRDILQDLDSKKSVFDRDIQTLITEVVKCYNEGLFDTSYENISRIAPELKPDLIYQSYGHIGMSEEEKNIGDALTRCFYTKERTYHGMALLPEQKKAIILSKCRASMRKDKKEKKRDDGQTKPHEYLVMMELFYTPTNEMQNQHDLGIFGSVGKTFCTGCIAGKGDCRHQPERLFYQLHHWTDERYGIDRPPTLDACEWANGGIVLCSDVNQPLSAQQCVQHRKTLEGQEEKMKLNAKRDCMSGIEGTYQLHSSSRKQEKAKGRYAPHRFDKFFNGIREHNKEDEKKRKAAEKERKEKLQRVG
jgi:hypothetical protein